MMFKRECKGVRRVAVLVVCLAGLVSVKTVAGVTRNAFLLYGLTPDCKKRRSEHQRRQFLSSVSVEESDPVFALLGDENHTLMKLEQ